MTDAVQLMQSMIDKYANDNKWANAPLGAVKSLSNTHIGDIGQNFVEEWCRYLGMTWESSGSRQSAWDARIQGITFEVKTATEDTNGNFQFNHIRHHRQCFVSASRQIPSCLTPGAKAMCPRGRQAAWSQWIEVHRLPSN